MTTCSKCGHEGPGAFCGNCGADLRGQGDATGTVGTQQSAEHREGWQDEATYTGYQSYPSRTSENPRQSSYRSGPVGSAPAPAPPNKNRRGNQMLGALVGVAAIAVFALVAYLFLRPGNGNSTAAPSVSNTSVATSKSGSSSSSASSSSGAQQPQQTVTETATAGGGGSGTSLDAVPGHVATNGAYAIGRSGNTVTVYKDSGSGAQQISTLTLNGSGDDSDLTMGSLPGCKAPIIAWNASSPKSSAAFGMTSSGSYQMFKAISGQYDMGPDGGDGSAGHSMGVYLSGSSIGFNDSNDGYDRSNDNNFDSCDSDGTTLHYSGTGS